MRSIATCYKYYLTDNKKVSRKRMKIYCLHTAHNMKDEKF